MAGYTVAHLDEIEEFSDAGCHYRPIRHHLGITAFGATAWTADVAGDRVINEHDEDDPACRSGSSSSSRVHCRVARWICFSRLLDVILREPRPSGHLRLQRCW